MGLQAEIDGKKKEIQTDGYPMSIGELARIYQDGELDIHPEFQRFFRWSDLQKSKLIESILLGIPVPPIFVAQRPDGVWDVVDGVQRLSTIFQFMGVLKDENGDPVEPVALLPTDYLPSLKGMLWEGDHKDEDEKDSKYFTSAQRISFKREKFDLRIIRKESDSRTKYELFQRLNTLGTSLSEQEVRNCLLIMINRRLFQWLSELAASHGFQTCISLSDRQAEERYDMELALRFLVYDRSSQVDLAAMSDVGVYLTDEMRSMAEDEGFDYDSVRERFVETFSLISKASEDRAFRRYSKNRGKFLGGTLVSAYEAISVGVAANLELIKKLPDSSAWLEGRIKEMWDAEAFKKNSGAGVRGTQRAMALVPFGREFFRP